MLASEGKLNSHLFKNAQCVVNNALKKILILQDIYFLHLDLVLFCLDNTNHRLTKNVNWKVRTVRLCTEALDWPASRSTLPWLSRPETTGQGGRTGHAPLVSTSLVVMVGAS